MCATTTIDTDITHDIERAAALIRDGQLVAFPTETVYGLGADATNGKAVAGIFEAKRRPGFNPLIVHVLSVEVAGRYAVFESMASALADRFWPGPLTIVLPAVADSGISSLVSAGLDTVAVRVPAHPLARMLLATADRPIAAPSANISGCVSPTQAHHVRDELGGAVPMILDGGPCNAGLESTIVDLSGEKPVLLRPGTITRNELEALLGQPVAAADADAGDCPVAPGQLASHYAPVAAVRLHAVDAADSEALIGFGPHMPKVKGPSINLSASGDLREAAANLFDALHQMDRPGISAIAVMPVPDIGIGEAINDRLRRAAAPRA